MFHSLPHGLYPLLVLTPLLCVPPRQDPPAGAAPDSLPDGAELMDRARAALGPPERLAAVGTLRARGSASWVGIPGEGEVTEVYGGLRRARAWTEFEGFGKFEHGADGELVWEKSPIDVKLRRGWDGAEVLRRYGRAQHVDWREMYSEARTAGVEDVDGTRCYRVELTPRALLPVETEESPPTDVWLVDAETLLPKRVLARALGTNGATTRVEVGLGGWSAVGGILYAHEREVTISGFTLALRFESFEQDVALPEDYFELDEDVRREIEQLEEKPQAERDREIAVQELEQRHIAAIRVTCQQKDMQRTLAVLLPETMQHVTASGVPMAGQPLVRYHSWGDPVDLEAAIPVTEPVAAKGRVRPETLPAGRAVVAWHVGPYHELGETHERILGFLEEHGLELRSAAWEEYWTDPGMEPDPSKWRTRVVYPVRERGAGEGG